MSHASRAVAGLRPAILFALAGFALPWAGCTTKSPIVETDAFGATWQPTYTPRPAVEPATDPDPGYLATDPSITYVAPGDPSGSTAVAEPGFVTTATGWPDASWYAVIDGNRSAVPDIPMGDRATIARILDEGKNRNKVMDHLTYLCTEIGPRLTGSANAEAANRWTRDQFESWGLTNAHLHQWGEIPLRFDRSPSTARVVEKRQIEEGGQTTTELRTVRDLTGFTTLSWAPGTNGPVTGQVVRMPRTEEEFAAVESKLSGAWVLIPSATRPGQRGIRSSASARFIQREEARERMALAAAGNAPAEEAPAEIVKGPEIPSDGLSGRWSAEVTGGPLQNRSMTVALDLLLAPDGTVTGSTESGSGATSSITDGKYDAATKTLTFKRTTGFGTVLYDLTVGDSTLSGTGKMAEGAGEPMTVTAKRPDPAEATARNSAAANTATERRILERVLAANPAGFLSSSGDERVWTGAVNGWRELTLDKVARDPEVSISMPDYDFINSRLADAQDVFLEINADNRFTPGPIPVYNTVAEIRGTHWPDQIVMVSAHLDSWDGPGSRGTIDNGTGSVVTMEAARLLMAAGAQPKRTIRFALWTGEEQGLLGSAAWVQQNQDDLPNISACFVDDGGTNYEGGLQCIGPMVPMLAAATSPINGQFIDSSTGKPMDVDIQVNERMPRGGASDHASFNRAGVPGFFWDEVGRANYGYGWHTQYDRLDQAIPEYLQQSSTCAAITAYNLACADEMLPREERRESGQQVGMK